MFFIKFIKFCLVGFSGLAIDFGITYLLKEKLRLEKYFSNGVGFMFAASSNYFLNRYWTFNSFGPMLKQYFWFVFIGLLGLIINTIILMFLVKKQGFNFNINNKLEENFKSIIKCIHLNGNEYNIGSNKDKHIPISENNIYIIKFIHENALINIPIILERNRESNEEINKEILFINNELYK